MLSSDLSLLASLILVFIYNILLFQYAVKILIRAKKSIALYVVLSCFNTFATYIVAQFPQYHYLYFFTIALVISIQFKFISKSSYRQSLFGAITFAFHIASINLPVIMAFSYFLGIPPLTLLEDTYYHHTILSTSMLILIPALFLGTKVLSTRDIIKISSSSPYSETLAATTCFILFYLSFDTYCFVSYSLFPEQAYQIFAITLVSLCAFYFLLIYTINFINLSGYKRQSDIAQTSYDNLLLQKKEASDKLITDHLTKLFNKKYMAEQLENILSHTGVSFGLLFMDVNALKYVNDTYGHDVGDEYIKAIAQALKESIRDFDIAARISGDEFLTILPYVDSEQVVESIAQRVSMQVEKQAKIKNFKLSASIGFVYVDEKLKKLQKQDIIDLADKKMRENKLAFYANLPDKEEVNNA